MNEAWTWCPLGKVTIPGSTWNPRTDPRPLIRYVDVSAVSRDELRIVSEVEHSAANAPSRARKMVKTGDTIFATVRPALRRIAQIPPSLDGEIVSTAFCVLRANPSVVRPDFLYFAMQLDSVTDGIASMETGASYPAVRDADVLNQAIPLPPLSDQRKVATALNLVRSTLLSQKRCEDTAVNLKRAAMQTLFTRGLEDEAQKETEIGPVPENWEIVAIDDIAVSTQYGLSVRGQTSGAYPILRMNCQEDGKVHYRNLQFVDLDSDTYDRFRVKPGDLLFNRTNSIDLVGRMSIVEDVRPAVFASYLVRLVVDADRCIPEFLNYFMNWPRTQGEIKKYASRAVGQANINATKLRTVPFPLPSINEQQNIVTLLDAIDRKIDLHRRKRDMLEELFKALLHKLMTGEISVGDLDLLALSEGISTSKDDR